MVELLHNELVFRFPELHDDAECRIDFQRTLRIPDDNREYPLPPGLGRFPVEHVDDFAARLPESWRTHGGVFIPMYQSEALWINFSGDYPCAIKVAAGKINAVSGKKWRKGLCGKPQDYVVTPDQPWLDGFNVSRGHVRQFVAMPLGGGFSAEEQITGEAEVGGLQIIVFPMKAEVYARHVESRLRVESETDSYQVCYSMAAPDMGLAPGGLMRQAIYEDEHGLDAWALDHGQRCFIHLANSEQYQAITGRQPPHQPPGARDYTEAGLPWFDYYSDKPALEGADILGNLASVAAQTIANGKGPLPDNDPVQPDTVKPLGKNNVVREGEF